MLDLAQAKQINEPSPGERIKLFPRRTLQPLPWVIPGVALRGHVSALFGPPGDGKSTIALHWGLAVALEEDFGTFEVKQSGPVLIVNREDDITVFDHRTWAYEEEHGAVGEDVPIEILDRPSVTIVEKDEKAKLRRTEFYAQLRQHITDMGAVLVILDPMIELAGNLSENDNGDMNFLVETLRCLAQEANCAVLALHHTAKGAGTGMDAMRGASSIAGRVRCANQVVRMPEQNEYNVDDHSRYRAIVSAKQNYMPSDKEDWLEFWAHKHEETDAWYPAIRHVVLSEKLRDYDVASFCDGKRATFDSRSDEAVHKLVATEFGVTQKVAKAKIKALEKDRGLLTETRYCSTAKKNVPHYVCKLTQDMPF